MTEPYRCLSAPQQAGSSTDSDPSDHTESMCTHTHIHIHTYTHTLVNNNQHVYMIYNTTVYLLKQPCVYCGRLIDFRLFIFQLVMDSQCQVLLTGKCSRREMTLSLT